MKRILLTFSAFCLIAVMSCKEDPAKKVSETNVAAAAKRDAQSSKYPVIVFDKKEHDFGEIVKGTPVTTTFSFKNTGEAPLVITDISTSCGCTVPSDWTREPIAVGESGKFTVKYNGSGQNAITKAITVTANTEKSKEIVKIKAFVKPKAAIK